MRIVAVELGITSMELFDLIAYGAPSWTFSDIRTKLYSATLAKAFPDQPLTRRHLIEAA